jgi:hypothetical protein
MELEIQDVVWDRHKYVAGFNQLLVKKILYCIVQYQISHTSNYTVVVIYFHQTFHISPFLSETT